MANFVSNDNATSLMNAINQKKDSKPTTITWAEWIALTDEQREGTHYIITNVPAKFSDKDAVFSIKDQTLTFNNKTATVTDSRITTGTYIFTFYHDQAVAQAAGIECSWTTGTVTFTVVDTPASDIVVDILCILPALATPAPEGGGHVIEDASGTDLPQQDTMQFADAFLTDDDVNGRTVVENVKELTLAELSQATERGMYLATDEESVPIGEIEEDVVSVTADGNTSYTALFNAIYSRSIDRSKLTRESMLVFQEPSGTKFYAKISKLYSNAILFTEVSEFAANTLFTRVFKFASSSSFMVDRANTSDTVYESQLVPNGTVITLHYGTSSGIVELNTDARHCMMSDGQSVEGAINNTFKQYTFDDVTLSTTRSYNDFSITLTADEISRLLFCNATVVESGVDIYQCYWKATNNGVRVIGKAQNAGTFTIKVTLVFSA